MSSSIVAGGNLYSARRSGYDVANKDRSDQRKSDANKLTDRRFRCDVTLTNGRGRDDREVDTFPGRDPFFATRNHQAAVKF